MLLFYNIFADLSMSNWGRFILFKKGQFGTDLAQFAACPQLPFFEQNETSPIAHVKQKKPFISNHKNSNTSLINEASLKSSTIQKIASVKLIKI